MSLPHATTASTPDEPTASGDVHCQGVCTCRHLVGSTAITPALLDVRGVGQFLGGLSKSFIEKLDASGQLGPMALRLGRRRLWSVDELGRWVSAGMPRREDWISETPGGNRAHAKGGNYAPKTTRNHRGRQV